MKTKPNADVHSVNTFCSNTRGAKTQEVLHEPRNREENPEESDVLLRVKRGDPGRGSEVDGSLLYRRECAEDLPRQGSLEAGGSSLRRDECAEDLPRRGSLEADGSLLRRHECDAVPRRGLEADEHPLDQHGRDATPGRGPETEATPLYSEVVKRRIVKEDSRKPPQKTVTINCQEVTMWYARCHLAGRTVRLLVDTGAASTVLDVGVYNKFRDEVKRELWPSGIALHAAMGTFYRFLGHFVSPCTWEVMG